MYIIAGPDVSCVCADVAHSNALVLWLYKEVTSNIKRAGRV